MTTCNEYAYSAFWPNGSTSQPLKRRIGRHQVVVTRNSNTKTKTKATKDQ